jgi:hypothetical protein
MDYIDITLPADVIGFKFPAGEEGTGVQPDAWAVRVVGAIVGYTEGVQWHCPDVFAVRYGSNYVATATAGNLAVRFHSNEGTFREGDDK